MQGITGNLDAKNISRRNTQAEGTGTQHPPKSPRGNPPPPPKRDRGTISTNKLEVGTAQHATTPGIPRHTTQTDKTAVNRSLSVNSVRKDLVPEPEKKDHRMQVAMELSTTEKTY